MKPITVPETPVQLGASGRWFTARLTPGTSPRRWQVFEDGNLTPVGYLEAVANPYESETEQLAVFDSNNQPIGERGKRDHPDYPPSVHSYANALHWIWTRLEGIG